MSIRTALIFDLYFSFHIIVSMPYIRIRTIDVSFKTLTHSSYKFLALTKDLMTLATLLPLTTFLLHTTLCLVFT